MEKRSESLAFINGSFDAREAREIITNVFSAKITFHEMKNFSTMERYGKPDETAVRRIPELRKALSEALSIISTAQWNNAKINIQSDIMISIADTVSNP